MKQKILYQSLLAEIIFFLMRCLYVDNTFGCLIELLVKMVIDFDSALIMTYDWWCRIPNFPTFCPGYDIYK